MSNLEMNGRLAVFAVAIAVATLAGAAPMKVCVIQPPYAHDPAKIGESVEWELDALAKCGSDLDVIVLPEASDRQDQAWTDPAKALSFKGVAFRSDSASSQLGKRFFPAGIGILPSIGV